MAEAKRNSWYRSRSAREQRLLLVMLLLLIICACYYAVWIPAQRNVSAAQQAYRQQQVLLQWMQANAMGMQPVVSTAPADVDTTLLPALLTTMAKDNHFSITRLETGSDDKVTLELEQASFNNLITALDDLEHTHHVTILAANISKSDTPGQVSATLQLRK